MGRVASHWLCAALASLTLMIAAPALAQPTTLRIATGRVAPFVLPQDGPLAGFSVDLWTVLAQRLGAEVVVTDLGANTGDAQLQAVRNGNPREAYDRLLDGTIQAVVYDAPTLQYWTTRLGGGELQVVGPLFRPVKYGIAVARGNPLRKRINEALLELYSDGTYEDIYRKWFGPAK